MTSPVKPSEKLQPYWEGWFGVCEEVGIPVPEPGAVGRQTFTKQFELLYDALLDYNQRVNLTRLTEPEDFMYRHVLDSLTLSPFIPEGARVADVGSGGGFPALPLAIARPDLRITAIDSVGKKCRFLEEAGETLKLGDQWSVVNERIETLGQDLRYREQFDVVAARGVAKLPVLLELCVPLVALDGFVLAMKGAQTVDAELDAAKKKALKSLKADIGCVHRFDHPRLAGAVLVMIDKQEPTPPRYPRQAGIPSKKPLV